MFRIFNRLFSRNKEKQTVSNAANPEVVNILNEFREKLDNIEKDISKMRVLIFELSNGKYNPFADDNSISPVDIHKKHDHADSHSSIEHKATSTDVASASVSVKHLLSDGKEDENAKALEIAERLERNSEELNQIHEALSTDASDSESGATIFADSSKKNAELNLENAEVALIQRFSSPRTAALDNYLSQVGQNNWSGKIDPFETNKKKWE